MQAKPRPSRPRRLRQPVRRRCRVLPGECFDPRLAIIAPRRARRNGGDRLRRRPRLSEPERRGVYDRPGPADAKLYKNRDLNPTIDLRGVLKGVLAEHFEAPAGLLATTVFPDSAAVAPYKGLVAV